MRQGCFNRFMSMKRKDKPDFMVLKAQGKFNFNYL